ncbi:hypothetical protein F5Y16DRAFT_372266 [Xylariaceae sp. FL0255]|nr:hypothetical protein F5Y16DRAFT_372266 [Xylariaceae sp. FL0255]
MMSMRNLEGMMTSLRSLPQWSTNTRREFEDFGSSFPDKDGEGTPMLENISLKETRPPSHAVIKRFTCIHSALAAMILMNLVLSAIVVSLKIPSSQSSLLGEVHGLVPNVDTEIVAFSSTLEEGIRAMNETGPSWTSLIPRGGGFIVVEEGWQKYQNDLPPRIQLPDQDVFAVSVFHQIHCLQVIFSEFNALLDTSDTSNHGRRRRKISVRSSQQHHHHGQAEAEEEDTLEHVGHCFDYIRNSLMCCGDTALEGQGSNTEKPGTLGEGSKHVCRNLQAIKTWTEENRPYTSSLLP